jgi:uncharacterized protein (DUF2147 family)
MAWTGRLQNQYDSLEEFEAYNEIYGLAARLGFDSAAQAWEANPVIGGSTNPDDYRKVSD